MSVNALLLGRREIVQIRGLRHIGVPAAARRHPGNHIRERVKRTAVYHAVGIRHIVLDVQIALGALFFQIREHHMIVQRKTVVDN